MQNNVTELTQKLLKSLDSNYNVTNMPEVIDIISVLERVAVTKELLETTRLGKYINELRRKTTNQDLRRRAKELLKKWRSKVLPTAVPEANGQIRPPSAQGGTTGRASTPNAVSPPIQVRNVTPRVSPGTPAKVSPPSSFQKVNPALQNRLVSPGVQRLVSPGPAGKLVSPQIPKRPAGSHPKMVSPAQQSHRLVSPQMKKVSPQMKKVSPVMQRLASPGVQLDNSSTKFADDSAGCQEISDVNLNQLKKRPANDILDVVNAKRLKLNGGVMDLDFSDSSNSSFKDVISAVNPELRREVIVINSDSNSSFPERIGEAHADHLQPKKRGRKKGSKNHKNLLDEAETSFSNKLAVSASRGGSKVKTTQEILAGIQSKNTTVGLGVTKPSKEDLEEKAAKLTERVSIIDQKLNANTHRNKNSQKHKLTLSASKPNERVIESGSVINDKSLLSRLKEEEEEVVVVDDADSISSRTEESHETDATGTQLHDQEFTGVKSLSVEEALAQLPAIDKLVLQEVSDEPACTCRLVENKPNDFSISEEDETDQPSPFEIVEDPDCRARDYLEERYRVHDISDEKIRRLHEACLPNVNGNWSLGTPRPEAPTADGLYINVVPNIYERLDKDVRPFDSFKKYSVSEGGHQTNNSVNVIKTEPNKVNGNGESDSVIEPEPLEPRTNDSSETNGDNRTEEEKVFREWYECVDRPSYGGDTLRILPYCILD